MKINSNILSGTLMRRRWVEESNLFQVRAAAACHVQPSGELGFLNGGRGALCFTDAVS